MGKQAFQDPKVAAIFDAYPKAVRAKLMVLRQLIYDVAAATDGVGPLQETLKWGQPSYLTPVSKSGTTIRIDHVQSTPGEIALYVHCQTTLVAEFRRHYGDTLRFEGNRALVLPPEAELPTAALGHCIAMALTYHLRKRAQ